MRELMYPFDAGAIIRRRKALRKALIGDGSARLHKKIAVLGGSTTSDIVKLLDLFLPDAGIEAEFYESEYAQYYQDAMFPPRELTDFAPDLIWVHTTGRNITNWPTVADSEQEVDGKLSAELDKFKGTWQALEERFHCPIIQNNFEKPFYRLLGNRDGLDFHGRTHFTMRLNMAFAEYAREHQGFYVNDTDYLSADFGLRQWADPAYWNVYKYALCFEAIPAFAFSVANIVKSLYGKNKKALAGLNHPEGVLRPEDFILIKANWESKDRNIAETAAQLNILPESIVFADDNPAERGIVRAQLKGVAAPELEGVENYIATMDRGGYFETTTFSDDDRKRNEMYKANALRAQQQASFGDY